jgi:hypothetical protein
MCEVKGCPRLDAPARPCHRRHLGRRRTPKATAALVLVEVRQFYLVTLLSLHRRRDGTASSAFQIIFSFEARSDLLDHFTTIGIVY